MKIHIYKKEEGRRFYITFNDVTSNGQGYGGSISLNIDDFKSLGEKINTELEKTEKENNEMVWNPRSQRHETVKKQIYEMDRHMEGAFQL